MILQDVLKRVSNFDEIWEILISDFYKYENLNEKVKEVAKEVFEQLQDYNKVVKKEDIVFAIPFIERNLDDELEEKYDLSLIRKTDLNSLPLKTYKSVEEASTYRNTAYSLIDMDRYEALGYEFVDITLTSENLSKIATTIFFELTWFGFDYEYAKENQEKQYEEVLKSVKQYEQDKKDGKEIKYLSMEEVFEDLGIKDERTEEEKEAERIETQQLYLKNLNQKIHVFQKYMQKEE